MIKDDSMITVSELSQIIGVSRMTIYKRISLGQMQSYKATNSNKVFVKIEDWHSCLKRLAEPNVKVREPK